MTRSYKAQTIRPGFVRAGFLGFFALVMISAVSAVTIDDFEDGDFSDWTKHSASTDLLNYTADPAEGSISMHVQDDHTGLGLVYKTFTANSTDGLNVSVWYRNDDNSKNCYMNFKDDTTTGIDVAMSSTGNFVYGTGRTSTGESYASDSWYRLHFIINFTDGSYTWYNNHTLLVENDSFVNSVGQINKIELGSGGSEINNCYVDDVSLSTAGSDGGVNSVPTYTGGSQNSTIAGSQVNHTVTLQDDNQNLDSYFFSFDNGTGTFVNDSKASISGGTYEVSEVKIVNSTVGATIRWRVWFNDTSGNENVTEVFSYTTTSQDVAETVVIDDFEDADFSNWSKVSGGSNPTLSQDTSIVAVGSGSVRIEDTSSASGIIENNGFKTTNEDDVNITLYVRNDVTTSNCYVSIGDASDGDGIDSARLGSNGNVERHFNTFTYDAFTADTWYKLSWIVNFSNASTTFYVDDNLQDTQAFFGNASEFSHVGIGSGGSETNTCLYDRVQYTTAGETTSINISSVTLTYNQTDNTIDYAATPVPSNATGVTYQVSFGDGSSNATSSTGSHTYSSAGNYTLSVEATDGQGNTVSNSTTIEVTTIALTENGTMNYTKFSGNPIISFQDEYSFEPSALNYRTGVIDFYYRHGLHSGSPARKFYYMNSTDPLSWNTAQQVDLGFLTKPTAPYPIVVGDLVHMFWGDELDNDTRYINHYVQTDADNMTAFEDACDGPILTSTTSNGYSNVAVAVESPEKWHMLIGYKAGAAGSDQKYFNSTDGCNWTEQGDAFTGYGEAHILGRFNGTWIVYTARYPPPFMNVSYFSGPDFLNLTLQDDNVFTGVPLQSGEKHAGSDPFLFLPSPGESFGNYTYYAYYVTNQDGNISAAYDTDNRTFYAAHNVSTQTTTPFFMHSLENHTISVGESWTYDANATDPENHIITYATNLSAATFDTSTGSFSWTPASTGTHLVSLNVTDGTTTSTETFTVDVVSNAAPGATGALIEPEEAYTNDTLVGWVNISDADGDTITVEFRWYKNGVLNQSGNQSGYVMTGQVNPNNLSSSLTTKGDNWTFSARSYDGTEYSNWTNSSPVEILDSEPSVEYLYWVEVDDWTTATTADCANGGTSEFSNESIDAILCVNLTDADGDNITTNWGVETSYDPNDTTIPGGCGSCPEDKEPGTHILWSVDDGGGGLTLQDGHYVYGHMAIEVNGSLVNNGSYKNLNRNSTYVPDITPPSDDGNGSVNTTASGAEAKFNLTITDNARLANYTFSTNASGSWTNSTPEQFSDVTQSVVANGTATLPASQGTVVGYKWYYEDHNNNTGESSTFTLTTTGNDTSPSQVTINISANSGSSPLTVDWNVSASGGNPPYTWQVDPGNGDSNSTSTSGSFTYSSSGNYTITATVTDSDGDKLTNTSETIEVLGPIVFEDSNITVVEDSYTSNTTQEFTQTNYGNNSNLYIAGDGFGPARTWLKFRFNLSNYTNITDAKLVLNATDAPLGTDRVRVSTAPNTWNESNITWLNQPCGGVETPNSSCENLTTVNDAGEGLNEYDITDWLEARRAAGDTEASLMLWTDTNDRFYQSSESGGFTPLITFSGQLNTSLTFNVFWEKNLSRFNEAVDITFIKRVDENNPVINEYTVTNGSLVISDFEVGPFDILYNRTGYVQKWHYLNITGLDPLEVDLYMKNTSDGRNTSIFVRDGSRDPLGGAVVKVQRYYNNSGWVTIDMLETDSAGEADFNLNRQFTYYKFLVQDGGSTILTSDRTLIQQDSYYFNQQSGSGSFSTYEQTLRTDSKVEIKEHANGTKYASATFNQLDGQSKSYTLTVKKRTSGGPVNVGSDSQSGSGGTITVDLPNTAGSYYAELTSEDGFHSAGDYENQLSAETFGNQGPMLGLFVTLAFALLGAFNLVAGLALALIGLVVSFSMGWMSIGVGSLVSMVIMVLIIMFGGSRR